VMLVDDNETNQQVLVRQLRHFGIEAVSCGDSRKAMQILTEASPVFDLAILDMQMPYVDGEELCRLIRKDTRVADIPLVLMSSIALRGDARKAQAMGFNAYLAKPVAARDLYNVLASLFSGEQIEPNKLVTRHSAQEQIVHDDRILLVEDNRTNQIVAQGILKKLGYSCEVAEDGQKAVVAVQQQAYDLILMDLQMPVMDGIEATLEIRQLEQSGSVSRSVIIAMTANAMQGDKERCLEAGMDDYLSKPIEPGLLAEKLSHWLPAKAVETDDDEPELVVNEESSVEIEIENREPTLDFDDLKARMSGDEGLIGLVLDSFLEDIGPQVEQLVKLVEMGDGGEIKALAHKIKGAAANISACRLARFGRELESSASQENKELAAKLAAEMSAEYQHLVVAIEETRCCTSRVE